jgi:hypothetical protein
MLIEKKSNKLVWLFPLGVIILCEILGVYLLIQSQLDPQSTEVSQLSEVIAAWSGYLLNFAQIVPSISQYDLVPTSTEYWGTGIEAFPNYTHLYYYTYSPIVSETFIEYSPNLLEHNVTSNFTLKVQYNNTVIINYIPGVVIHSKKIVPLNFKVCRNAGVGYWDGKTQACYYHYSTNRICIVLDKNYTIVPWYKYGCDNNGYTHQTVVTWPYAYNYTEFNYKIVVEVRSEYDPYVFASYNGMIYFSPSSQEYAVIGIVVTLLSTILMLVYCYYFHSYKRIRLNISGDLTSNNI